MPALRVLLLGVGANAATLPPDDKPLLYGIAVAFSGRGDPSKCFATRREAHSTLTAPASDVWCQQRCAQIPPDCPADLCSCPSPDDVDGITLNETRTTGRHIVRRPESKSPGSISGMPDDMQEEEEDDGVNPYLQKPDVNVDASPSTPSKYPPHTVDSVISSSEPTEPAEPMDMPVLKAAPNMSAMSLGQRMLGQHISREIAAAREQIVRELKADLVAMKTDVSKLREELASQQLGMMAIGRNIGNDVRKSIEAVTGVGIPASNNGNAAGSANAGPAYTGTGNSASETQSGYAVPEAKVAPEGYDLQQGGQADVNELYRDPSHDYPDTQDAQKRLGETQEMGFNDFVDVNAAKDVMPVAPNPQDEPQYQPVSAQWTQQSQAISGSPNEQYFGLPKRLRKTRGGRAPADPSPTRSRAGTSPGMGSWPNPSPPASAAA
jgi:hypothetical protein